MTNLQAKCRRDYKAVHTSGDRSVSVIRWIVLHDEESPSAEGAAKWFTQSAAGGSAHLCVDDKECFRTLANTKIAWGAPGANTYGFHIEQAGYARWSAVVWRKHLTTLRRAAYKTAIHCKAFNIPVRFVTAKDLDLGRKGITTHAECSKAFGGDHTDPGPGWPRWLFMRLVKSYYAQL